MQFRYRRSWMFTGLVWPLLLPEFATADAGNLTSTKDWPTVGGDSGNMRYSELSTVNIHNIDRLGGAWFHELATPTRAAPVVLGGAIYTVDGSAIYKLDAINGKTLWEYQPTGGAPARGGVALGEGLVFCGLSDTHVIALDQNTGELVWTGYIGNPSHGSGSSTSFGMGSPAFDTEVGFISGAPTYVNGMVISGVSGGDAGTRGKVAAVDAKTGEIAWVFYPVPTPGESGSETWPNAESLRHGGGAVFTHGAADADLGLVYFGTGNAVPALGGELRAGDNLYTASIVALDIKTGKLRWYFQLTHHDIWDMDVSTPPILYTAYANGRKRKAVAVMRTDGYLFLLDRESGQPVHPVEERAVKQDVRLYTAATQPFPVNADELGPPCTDPATMPPGFKPSCFFDPFYFDKAGLMMQITTARLAPMAFNPKTGFFYVMGAVSSAWYPRVENPYATYFSKPPGTKDYGIYAAIDSRSDKIVWHKRSSWPMQIGGGALTTAGGLLFYTEADGTFRANNARTGEPLWQFQTGLLPSALGGPGGVPAATYEAGGTQFVLAPVDKGLWAFKLGGNLPQRAALPPPPTEFGFSGIVKQIPADGSGEIAIAARRSAQVPGVEFMDEYAFVPTRARVRAGVSVKWTNYGVLPHTIVADDGSWATTEIMPGQSASVTISKPGSYVFFSREYPWSRGQIIVQ